MNLAIPMTSVYSFERTSRSTRLLYFIPLKRLKVIVGKRGMKEEVLRDFPFGLEAEVSDSEFDFLHEAYGFRPAVSAELIWIAFFGLLRNSNNGNASVL